jgi:hypothetical protein
MAVFSSPPRVWIRPPAVLRASSFRPATLSADGALAQPARVRVKREKPSAYFMVVSFMVYQFTGLPAYLLIVILLWSTL